MSPEHPDEPCDATLLEALRAIRRGDFRVRLPAGQTGLPGEIAEAFNDIVELNARTSAELRRISRIVGREGRIGQRTSIGEASGEWARNIDSVNQLIGDLTEPTREVSRVLGAVARGDLSQRVTMEIDGRPLLAAISHDLKTPATIIKGRANLLQRALKRADLDGSDQMADGLQAIDESTAQLVRLVDELLDLTRLRMGHPVELDRGPTDLVRIARRLADEYQNISPRHTIRVDTDLARLLGNWDEARIERVVSNLISNAVKYSPRGGDITIIPTLEEQGDEEWAGLVVRDNGIGIPSPELERVFEPYYRGTNVATSISGSGVGLAGTRHIVEQHGGQISVDSVVGKSTTFTVRLPLVREETELVDA